MQQSITFDTQVDEGLDVALAVAYAYGYDSVEELIAAAEEDDTDDTDDTDDDE